MAIDLPNLVQTFAPQVYYHPDETYLPSSTDYYVPQASYVAVADGAETTYAPGTWSWSGVPGAASDYLSVPDDPALLAGSITTAAAYVHVLDVSGMPNQVDLQYWFFYPFNGDETVRVEAPLELAAEVEITYSEHFGDWEHVTVRVDITDESTPKIVAVYYSQHSWGQWTTQAPSGDPDAGYSLTSGTHPVAYCARGTHAHYPAAGGPYLIGGGSFVGVDFMAVDYTGKGQSVSYWNTGRTVIVANESSIAYSVTAPGWIGFEGRWGQPTTVRMSALELGVAVVQFIASAVGSSPWLSVPLAALLASSGIPIVAALGACLIGWLIPNDQEGPLNPPSQGSWSKTPAFLAWTPDKQATSVGFGQPALVTTQAGVLACFSGVITPPLTALWQGESWQPQGAVGGTMTIGPIAATAIGPMGQVAVFPTANGATVAYLGSTASWQPISGWPGTRFGSGFSLALCDQTLFFVYRTTGGALGYLTSTAPYASWSAEQVVPGTSVVAGQFVSPSAIAVRSATPGMPSTLYVAYLQTLGADTTKSDIVITSYSDVDGTGTWGEQYVVADQATVQSPSLVWTGSQFVCAYTDTSQVVRYTVSADGAEWTDPSSFPNAKSHAGPALAVDGSTLVCVHPGASHAQSWFSTVTLD